MESRVLWVEPYSDLQEQLREILELLKIDSFVVSSGEDAYRELRNSPVSFRLVVSALRLPDGSGMDFLRKVKADYPRIKLALCTGTWHCPEFRERFGDVLDACWEKPIMVNTLVADLGRLLHR